MKNQVGNITKFEKKTGTTNGKTWEVASFTFFNKECGYVNCKTWNKNIIKMIQEFWNLEVTKLEVIINEWFPKSNKSADGTKRYFNMEITEMTIDMSELDKYYALRDQKIAIQQVLQKRSDAIQNYQQSEYNQKEQAIRAMLNQEQEKENRGEPNNASYYSNELDKLQVTGDTDLDLDWSKDL